jgi:hypothetical protein
MQAGYTATIISKRVICEQPGRYIGWPTIARTREGELLVVFSGDRDAHVCPWGKTYLVRSSDRGATWSDPALLNNTPLDDRDAGIIQTARGTLLVSWFTALGFLDPHSAEWQDVPQPLWECWCRHGDKLDKQIRGQWLGNWVRRSVDGGTSWGDPISTSVSAPHGPIQLSDGRLVYVGTAKRDYELAAGHQQVLAAESSEDDGCSWERIGTVPVPAGEVSAHYHEPHVVETTDGRLVAMFRYQPPEMAERFLRQSESSDGGKSWSVAHPTPIWGYPPHLTLLSNGWLLVTYGRRIPPFGERACISRDGGATWDVAHEITLCDAPSGDLGYPASVQLGDGSILSVFYQASDRTVHTRFRETSLLCTHWRLDGVAAD